MANNGSVLDDASIIDHTNDYTFRHGPNFNWPGRILAGLFSLFIFLIVPIFMSDYISPLIGIVLLVPTLFYLTAHTGVEVCVRTKYFRAYSTYVGFKYGKWKSSRGLSDVAILTIRKKMKVKSTGGSNILGVENIETGVYFLIPSHRKRVLISICKNKREADKVGQDLADKLDKKFTTFNPEVSAAS